MLAQSPTTSPRGRCRTRKLADVSDVIQRPDRARQLLVRKSGEIDRCQTRRIDFQNAGGDRHECAAEMHS